MKSPEKVLKSDLPGRTYAFDGLTVDVSRRVVQRADAVLHLYPRAFDALALLIEQRSAVVSKDELMARLWPDVIVEENSLARLISDLRKALGDAGRLIATVPKRGYRFDGEVDEARGAASQRRTADAEADGLFHRGRYWLARRAWDGAMARAIECLEGAVARDPGFAAAHAALAEAHLTSTIAVFGDTQPPLKAIPLARAAAERALELDPRLADAQAVLAHIAACFDWNWPQARELFEAAIRNDARHVATRQFYAIGLMAIADFDGALRQLELAREVDPSSLLTRVNVGFVLSRAGRLDKALPELEQCLELEPGFAYGRYRYGLALQQAGRLAEAGLQFERMRTAPGARIPMLAAQAHLAAAMHEDETARALAAELRAIGGTTYVSAWFLAEIAAGLGDMDDAIAYLNAALEEHSMLLIGLENSFKLDGLRGDPRFVEIRRRVGLWG